MGQTFTCDEREQYLFWPDNDRAVRQKCHNFMQNLPRIDEHTIKIDELKVHSSCSWLGRTI